MSNVLINMNDIFNYMNHWVSKYLPTFLINQFEFSGENWAAKVLNGIWTIYIRNYSFQVKQLLLER